MACRAAAAGRWGSPSVRVRRHAVAETVAGLARRGSHIGVLTRSAVDHDLAAGTLVELLVADLPRWQVTLALAYRTEGGDTAAITFALMGLIWCLRRCR